MKPFKFNNDAEVIKKIIHSVSESVPSDFDLDYNGQLVIPTGIYLWEDGKYHEGTEVIYKNKQ